jgi:hypothetical protein
MAATLSPPTAKAPLRPCTAEELLEGADEERNFWLAAVALFSTSTSRLPGATKDKPPRVAAPSTEPTATFEARAMTSGQEFNYSTVLAKMLAGKHQAPSGHEGSDIFTGHDCT